MVTVAIWGPPGTAAATILERRLNARPTRCMYWEPMGFSVPGIACVQRPMSALRKTTCRTRCLLALAAIRRKRVLRMGRGPSGNSRERAIAAAHWPAAQQQLVIRSEAALAAAHRPVAKRQLVIRPESAMAAAHRPAAEQQVIL